jgi:L-alanine-DL-glutamate epimerase-like enolase superfamily enzyme
VKLHLHEFELPLRHIFTISRESYSVQPTLIVELQDGEHHGYGEATTNSYYGISFQSLRDTLESVRPQLEQASLDELLPEGLWAGIAPNLQGNSFALCAVDQAAHDLWGKRLHKPVYELWGLTLANLPPSCFTIGIDDIDVMVDKMSQMPGWPIYKIKLGTDHDVDIIQRLREHTDAILRVDANCGWEVGEALRNAEAMASLGVEFIEQPLRADNWSGHRMLFEDSPLPIFADESCIQESDVARCEGFFHGVNIKLMKCGGLTPARRMIDQAKQCGMQVMVGCMTESTVGISAIAQLLPLLDYVDMDGAALLAEDIASGVRVEQGVCHFPTVHGTGVELIVG